MTEALWIFAEHQDDRSAEASLELIGEGRRLADLHRLELGVLLFGRRVEPLAETLARYGAEKVYLAEHEALENYNPELFTAVLAGLVKAHDPGLLLLSATTLGQDLAPRVAARLKTCLAPGCDKLEISAEGLLLQTRLIYQNKVHGTVTSPGVRPQMATLTPGAARIKPAAAAGGMQVIKVESSRYVPSDPARVRVTGFIKADPRTVDISDATLIVSGGKGVRDEAGFQLIRELAEAMNAAVAGSRMAVDHQWIDRARQIGQSGKTVCPDLMISCGVSGASAHIFGLRDTKTIIAVNKDKAAPMMKMADLAVVGNLHDILPVLIKRLKEINTEKS